MLTWMTELRKGGAGISKVLKDIIALQNSTAKSAKKIHYLRSFGVIETLADYYYSPDLDKKDQQKIVPALVVLTNGWGTEDAGSSKDSGGGKGKFSKDLFGRVVTVIFQWLCANKGASSSGPGSWKNLWAKIFYVSAMGAM